MRLLITGVAGFIGFHVVRRLLRDGVEILGIDNISPYYDVALKESRLRILQDIKGFKFEWVDISDRRTTELAFERFRPERVVHLAAQAGVRYSLENPHAYVESNLVGFLNILQGCRLCEVGHLVYASSSSVYGANAKIPFAEQDNVDHPVSLYAATKKANELMAHTYSHLYGIPTTGLRLFTVYGPWGRPDMAPFLFTRAILEDRPINLYNDGDMQRDFTYVDDIAEAIIRVVAHIPQSNSIASGGLSGSRAPYKVYNVGNSKPIGLLHFVRVIERCLGREAKLNLMPMQPGDVLVTFADIGELVKDIGYAPATPLEIGLPKFVEWYKAYYMRREAGA